MGDEKELKSIYDQLIKRIKYGEILNTSEISKLNKINDIDIILEDIYSVIKKIKSLGVSPQEFFTKSQDAIKNFSQTIQNTPFIVSILSITSGRYFSKN